METLAGFFVLEGLDGAGTTTQLSAAGKALPEIWTTFEPTDDPIGLVLRRILKKEIDAAPGTIARLFATDRYQHVHGIDGILDRTARGQKVLCDRYLFSSLAYQGMEFDFDQVWALNRDFPLPEALFFVDVPVIETQRRLGERVIEERYDAFSFQDRLRESYERAFRMVDGQGMRLIRLDGTLTPAEIAAEIIDFIR